MDGTLGLRTWPVPQGPWPWPQAMGPWIAPLKNQALGHGPLALALGHGPKAMGPWKAPQQRTQTERTYTSVDPKMMSSA